MPAAGCRIPDAGCVHVSWLRQKLGPDPHSPRYIVTVFGIGCRFEPRG